MHGLSFLLQESQAGPHGHILASEIADRLLGASELLRLLFKSRQMCTYFNGILIMFDQRVLPGKIFRPDLLLRIVQVFFRLFHQVVQPSFLTQELTLTLIIFLLDSLLRGKVFQILFLLLLGLTVLRGKRGIPFHILLGPLVLLRFCLGQVIYLLPDPSIDVRPSNLFQDGSLLLVLAVQKTRELALRQHGGLTELAEVRETRRHYDLMRDLPVIGQFAIRPQIFKRPFFPLKTAGGLGISPFDTPAGLVRDPVGSVEFKRGRSFSGAFTQQATGILHLQLDPVVFLDSPFHIRILHTGRIRIQRQAQSIQNGALPRTGVAGDQENVAVRQRRLRKIDDGVLDGRDIVDGQFPNLHRSF